MSSLLPCTSRTAGLVTLPSYPKPRQVSGCFLPIALLLVSIGTAAMAQTSAAPIQVHERSKPRIAVFPFDDRTTANKDMNIGTKVADEIIAKLATNSDFVVYDRNHVDRLLQEKNLKYDPNYDSASAAKSGLMGTVDIVISGQVAAFNANTQESSTGFGVMGRHTITGIVSLKVRANLISVEKGSILLAPDADNDAKDVLASDMKGSLMGHSISTSDSRKSVDEGLRKLVDKAATSVAQELSTKISPLAEAVQPVLVAASATPAKPGADESHSGKSVEKASTGSFKATFVGISGGLAYVDKGSMSGVKSGDKLIVRRAFDTGLKDGSGQPIQHHRPVCILTVTEVEENSAAGKCVPEATAKGPDAIPKKGDEVTPAAN